MNRKGVYIRRDPSTLTGRIRSFYERNPGEFLDIADVPEKFGCTTEQAKNAIDALQKSRVVERVVVLRAVQA